MAQELAEIEVRLYGSSVWEAKGCTPRMVLEFARGRGLGASIIHNGSALEQMPGPTPLVAALHEDHLYFYKGRARRKLLAWRCAPSGAAKLRREHATSAETPPASAWLPWVWTLEPGHYWADEDAMSSIRA